jgi:hypothetical protein
MFFKLLISSDNSSLQRIVPNAGIANKIYKYPKNFFIPEIIKKPGTENQSGQET